MFLFRLLLLPFKVLFGTTKVASKTGYRAGRLLGYRRIFVLGAGIAIGLLIAPVSGRELRRKLTEAMQGTAGQVGGGEDLAEHVRHHLRQAPRTWHLPQPVVTEVAPGRIRLDGAVADDSARRDLEVTTAQVTGVADVDNQVRLSG
jgi:hypothetical protein